jgi:hypothetical protein
VIVSGDRSPDDLFSQRFEFPDENGAGLLVPRRSCVFWLLLREQRSRVS